MIVFTVAFAIGFGALTAIARKSNKAKGKQEKGALLSDDELITVILPTIKSLD